MADAVDGAASNAALSATYQSPANPSFAISKPCPPPPSGSVEARSKYLSDLRQAVVEMQDEVNKELTARMEEDKAGDAGTTTHEREGGARIDEAEEEENYGEDVQEEGEGDQ